MARKLWRSLIGKAFEGALLFILVLLFAVWVYGAFVDRRQLLLTIRDDRTPYEFALWGWYFEIDRWDFSVHTNWPRPVQRSEVLDVTFSRGYTQYYSKQILWVPITHVMLAVLGMLSLRKLLTIRGERAARREAAGLCASCGYDLRATPERCPECGFAPTPRPDS